jgi:hypothetical protein
MAERLGIQMFARESGRVDRRPDNRRIQGLPQLVLVSTSALPLGNNGDHFGDYRNLQDNGKHVGAGAGMGKYDNTRRGLR